jgi:hypothetical protein
MRPLASAEGMIRDTLNQYPKYRGVMANEQMILSACVDRVTNESVLAAPQATRAIVKDTIRRLGPNLGVNRDYADAFEEFFNEFPQYKNQANEGILAELAGDDISAANLAYLAGMTGVQEKLCYTAEYQHELAEAKRRLVARNALAAEAAALQKELLDRYKDPTTGKLFKTIQPAVYKKEEQRVLNLDIEQLRQEVADVREKKRLASLSPADLRKEIHKDAVQKQQQAYTERFPQMPKEFYPRGSFTPIPLNRQTLIRIANTDREFFRILTEKYGSAQLDARLQEQI